MVAAWEDDFTGYVVDYGTFPDQKRPYFTLRDARHTLSIATKTSGLEGSIYAGLERLTADRLSREWKRDDGAMIRIERCLIDANWGSSTDVVYQFCRQDHGGIKIVPIKHSPYVTRDDPTLKKKNRDPLHPELGVLTRLELSRDYWLDRVLGRFQADADPEIGGSVVLPPETSNEFIQHFKANHQVELEDRHGHLFRSWERGQYTPDETISSRVAKHRGHGDLGDYASQALDAIDPGHSERSIEPDEGKDAITP